MAPLVPVVVPRTGPFATEQVLVPVVVPKTGTCAAEQVLIVAGLRKFGVMPHVWAGGHGTGAAPIQPLVDATERK